MCITFFKIGCKEEEEEGDCSQFPFVLTFNRDEVTYRTSEKAHFLSEQTMPNIVCGIDV